MSSLLLLLISPVFADHTPDAPTNFAIDFDNVNGTNVPLTWTAPSGSLGNYTLQGTLETGGVGNWAAWMNIEDKTILSNATSYDLDTTGAPVTGIYYKLRLVATHGINNSTASNEAFGGNIPDNPTVYNSIEDFKAGRAFADAESFQAMQDFVGIMTFGTNTDFDHATKFASGQTFSVTQLFDSYQYFDDNTDFTNVAQTFTAGTSFGEGTTFKNDGSQSLPAGTIPSFGVMLDSFTCDTASCLPSDASKFLAPGDLLAPGTDPAASYTKIKPDEKTLTIDGLGLTMTFDTVSTTGTVKTDLYDPALIPSSTLGNGGKVSMSTSSGNVETIGSVIDLTPEKSKSDGTAAVISGTIDITLPYKEANIPAGTDESQLTMLHYENGSWKTEENCTIDTVNNKITCTVTSLSPFGIGGAPTSGSGGGKGNCDSNAFGNNNSLRIYEISYDVDTSEVKVQAYSTCGSVSAKITTPTQQSILGLSTDQQFIHNNIATYSGFLDESDEKFNISIQNKRNSFTETFYIYDKSITKKYTGETGYTSEQQGTPLPTIEPVDTTASSKPFVDELSQITEETDSVESASDMIVEQLTIDEKQLIEFTPEPVAEEPVQPVCGSGTELVNGFCSIIQTNEPKSCFLFWCW